MREPGGNLTGVRYPGPDLAIKRFEIMREIVPNAKRIWIPFQRGYPIVTSQLEALRPAAASTGVALEETPISDVDELKSFLQKRAESPDIGMDAILFIAEPLCVRPDVFAVLGQFADEHRIPAGGAFMSSIEGHESVFGVTTDSIQVGRQAAVLADKILRGTLAGTIPVVSAEGYLTINYRAAKKQGIQVSEGLLSRANEIIR